MTLDGIVFEEGPYGKAPMLMVERGAVYLKDKGRTPSSYIVEDGGIYRPARRIGDPPVFVGDIEKPRYD